MSFFRALVLSALAVLTTVPTADAGLFRHRVRIRAVVRYSAPVCYAAGGSCVATVPVPVAVPVPPSAPTPAAPSPQASAPSSSDAASFLASLNAWRALHGRPAASWDAGLAAYAALNSGVHQPGTNGGGGQCWASAGSLTHALAQWIASPAHAAILLTGNVVGASLCPSGTTANVR